MSVVPSKPVSSIYAGVLGRCPRCGKGKMFKGFIAIAPECSVCHLDYSFADAGDGPAVFVTLFGGFFVLGLVMTTQILWDPPYWVYLVIFLPLTLIICLGLLRPLKGFLVARQYSTKASHGGDQV
ncbi:MAG: DUF983 domain-containing protein [Hyphomicrobiales bacterium]|nr:DUF983 domain-containing protein [Hyphomicrobiales bacterium]MDE2113516.1 DUF983 domain-containing protein [Hyphomicrobiales bacterium]